ncbi:MAG TPA: phosphotransferase [Bacillus sp. (in: firmicutes)]|nr:phosphotransferase [Bacillus sp. (in: firmicutes)]
MEKEVVKRFEPIIQRINSGNKLLHVWEIKGGISAQVWGLEVLQPNGQKQKMIVRQHGDNDYFRNPNIAADEFRLLELLDCEGILVPKPFYLDQSGVIFTRSFLVMEFIDGKNDFNPTNVKEYISQLANHLANIHRVDISKLDVSFLPLQNEICIELLNRKSDNSLNEYLMQQYLKSGIPLSKKNQDVILHGDFWPGNILWKDGKLVAVIDWEDAAIGDPLSDLANGRLEVLFKFGIEAMNEFTSTYQSLMPQIDYTDLPYWELFAALRLSVFTEWGLDKQIEKVMREKHEWFVTHAFTRMNKGG